MINDIFPTPLYQIDLNCNIIEMQKYCFDIMSKDTGRTVSNSGGWQSQDLKGVHLVLNELFEDIEHHGNILAKELYLKNSLKIDNIWININGYKDYNLTHSHINTFLSGVFYVKCPKNCGNIVFNHPTQNTQQYNWGGNKFDKLSKYSYGTINGQSIENRMYLFPSWLEHFVTPNLNETEKRISIAFNLGLK
jgi:uncharacterized protein (TIGR02466 family)